MVATAKRSMSNRSGQGFWSDRFRLVLLTLSSLVFLFGVGGFFYIEANSPLALIGGGDRPVAAAALFVPNQSPFTFSLLTQPKKLVAFAQSLEDTKQRQQTLEEIAQVEQQFLNKTGLDYAQAIQSWLGEEATFALVSTDIDADASNGEQPGYLVALEIAPNGQREAKEFLQLFWQQQTLVGNTLESEAISGVRILSTPLAESQSVKATALVGDQFVLLANDVRVLRRSLQVAQTAQNLAQTSAYRQAATDLPKQRVGLAYFDLDLLNDAEPDTVLAQFPDDLDSPSNKSFTAVSIGLERTGIVANALVEGQDKRGGKKSTRRMMQPVDSLRFLPVSSEVVIASHDLPKLKSNLAALGLSAQTLSTDELPALFQSVLLSSTPSPLQPASGENLWSWATGDYALAKVGSGSQDWVLAVERDDAGIAALDEQAIASGYSKSVIAIEETTTTVWSRLVARNSTRRSNQQSNRQQNRQSASELTTELLGLHVQQGQYEIFTNSLVTMSSVLATSETVSAQDAPLQNQSAQDQSAQDQSDRDSPAQDSLASTSLVQSAKFQQAIEPLVAPNQGYLYLYWPTVAPALSRRFPLLNQAITLTAPLSTHIETVTATCKDELVNLFARLKP